MAYVEERIEKRHIDKISVCLSWAYFYASVEHGRLSIPKCWKMSNLLVSEKVTSGKIIGFPQQMKGGKGPFYI